MYAAKANQLEAVALLLESKADPNAKVTSPHESGGGQSVLDYACGSHSATEPSVPIDELLLKQGADPNNRANNGFSTLEMSVAKNNVQIIELLIKYGAKVDPPSGTVESAFQGAASVDLKNVQERTALSFAAEEAGRCYDTKFGEEVWMPIIKLLIEKGADPSIKDRDGMSPIDWAAFNRMADDPERSKLFFDGAAVYLWSRASKY